MPPALLVLILLFLPLTASAATYVVPRDADLIRAADAIAVVTVQSSHSYFAGSEIVTDYYARIERSLKGAPAEGTTIVVTQRGGAVGDLALSVSGEPGFVPGERALLMMRQIDSWRFITAPGELGKFSFVVDSASRRLLVRGATTGEILGWDLAGMRHRERGRHADAFVRYIEEVVAGGAPAADYFVDESRSGRLRAAPDSHVRGNDYMMLFTIGSTSQGSRWSTGAFTTYSVGTQSGVTNLSGSIGVARGVWNSAPGASISIGYAGATTGGSYGDNDGRNLMFFDQPDSGVLAGSVVGQANVWASSATTTNGSDTYFTTMDCDIVVQAGFTGSTFETILGHELGHCLGFRHSNQPQTGQVTFSSDALMSSSVSSNYNLRAWDQDAASHVYGSGASTCTPPSITSHPQSVTIQAGQTATLSVGASGTGLTYQWYAGSSGDTSRPISGATSSRISVQPASTVSLWVRVSGQCGTPLNSNTATVTVVESCTPPSITSQPQSVTIQAGQTATLTVGASGTLPLSYQWYVGSSGDTSRPISGATSASLSVQPSATVNLWVRVSGQCGTPVNSNTATVTVLESCTPPSITTQPQSTTIQAGQTATLTVSAAGTGLSYQWYRGTSGDTSNPLAGATSWAISVAPTMTTSFWVRVAGQCGNPVNSAAATVTVTPLCTAPSITSTTPSQSIRAGSTLTLTANAAGTDPLQYAWFEGAVGDMSRPVGSGASITVGPLSQSTRYWGRVTNACGEARSGAIEITVTPPARRRAAGRS